MTDNYQLPEIDKKIDIDDQLYKREIAPFILKALGELGYENVKLIEIFLSSIKYYDENSYHFIFFLKDDFDIDIDKAIKFEEEFSNISNRDEFFRIVGLG